MANTWALLQYVFMYKFDFGFMTFSLWYIFILTILCIIVRIMTLGVFGNGEDFVKLDKTDEMKNKEKSNREKAIQSKKDFHAGGYHND